MSSQTRSVHVTCSGVVLGCSDVGDDAKHRVKYLSTPPPPASSQLPTLRHSHGLESWTQPGNALLESSKVSTVTAFILQTEILKHTELESRAQEAAGSGPRGPSPALTPRSTTCDQDRLGGSDPAL